MKPRLYHRICVSKYEEILLNYNSDKERRKVGRIMKPPCTGGKPTLSNRKKTSTCRLSTECQMSRNQEVNCDMMIFDWTSRRRKLPIPKLGLFFLLIALLQLASECTEPDKAAHKQVASWRTKRWADDTTTTTSNNNVTTNKRDEADEASQQARIPAASPNFEAAFQGECGKNNNSNPCEHVCLDLHDGTYECSCFYGFTLAVDGYSCAPVALAPRPGDGAETVRVEESVQLSRAPGEPLGAPVRQGADWQREPQPGAAEKAGSVTLSAGGGDEPIRLARQQLGGKIANDNRKLATELARGGAESSGPPPPPTMTPATRRPPLAQRKRQLQGSRRLVQPEEALRRQQKLSRRKATEGELASAGSSNNNNYYYHSGNNNSLSVGAVVADNKQAAVVVDDESPRLRPQIMTITGRDGEDRAPEALPSAYNDDTKVGRTELADGHQDQDQDGDQNKDGDGVGDKEEHVARAVRQKLRQRLSYDVEADDAWRPEREDDELLDPDISALMRNNDELVRQLARAVAGPLTSARNQTPDEDDDDDDKAQLDRLAALVQSSIEQDYAVRGSVQIEGEDIDEQLDRSASTDSRPLRDRMRRSSLAGSTWGRADARNGDDGTGDNNLGLLEDPSLCQQRGHYESEARRTSCAGDECESGGRCSQTGESKSRCRCPIGRGGHLCQKPTQRAVPKFAGRSYLALPMITEPSLTNLRLLFRPEERQRRHTKVPARPQLLLQFAQEFALLLYSDDDDTGRVELRYSERRWRRPRQATDNGVGQVTRVIGSRDVELNKWNELIVTDVTSDSQASAASHENPLKVILITPEQVPLASSDQEKSQRELFVGGTPDLAAESNEPAGYNATILDAQVVDGFVGCIRELSINGRSYNFRSDLNGDSLDGFDILECCQ